MSWFKKGPEGGSVERKEETDGAGEPAGGQTVDERVAKKLADAVAKQPIVKDPSEAQLEYMAEIREKDLSPIWFALTRQEYATVFEGKKIWSAVALLYAARKKEGNTAWTLRGVNLAPGKKWEDNAVSSPFFNNPVGSEAHFASLIKILQKAGYNTGEIESTLRSELFLNMLTKGHEASGTDATVRQILTGATAADKETVRANISAAIRRVLFAN